MGADRWLSKGFLTKSRRKGGTATLGSKKMIFDIGRATGKKSAYRFKISREGRECGAISILERAFSKK